MKPLSMQTVCLSPQPSDCKRPTHSSSRSESVLLSAAWRAFPHHHSTAWCSGSNLQSCGLLCDCVRMCVMTRGHSEDYTFINIIYIYMVGVWAEWAKILKTFKYFWISFISNHLSSFRSRDRHCTCDCDFLAQVKRRAHIMQSFGWCNNWKCHFSDMRCGKCLQHTLLPTHSQNSPCCKPQLKDAVDTLSPRETEKLHHQLWRSPSWNWDQTHNVQLCVKPLINSTFNSHVSMMTPSPPTTGLSNTWVKNWRSRTADDFIRNEHLELYMFHISNTRTNFLSRVPNQWYTPPLSWCYIHNIWTQSSDYLSSPKPRAPQSSTSNTFSNDPLAAKARDKKNQISSVLRAKSAEHGYRLVSSDCQYSLKSPWKQRRLCQSVDIIIMPSVQWGDAGRRRPDSVSAPDGEWRINFSTHVWETVCLWNVV